MSYTFSKGFLATFFGILAVLLFLSFLSLILCGGCGAFIVATKHADDERKADARVEQLEADARARRAQQQRLEKEKMDDIAPDNPDDPFD